MSKLDISYLPNAPYCILQLPEGNKAMVTFEDFSLVCNVNWFIDSGSETPGYRRVYRKDSKNKTEYLHRVLLNAKKGDYVDHINGDTFDNRRCNLRITDAFGSTRNRGLNKNNSSGYKGVSFDKSKNKFRAYIVVDYKQINLGHFNSAKEGAEAYNKAALKYFKEFARLNNV